MAANKQTGDSSAKKTKSPFISFCMTTVVCLLIVAVTFAVVMFKTDTIFSTDVTDSTFRIATRNNTTTYSTTTMQIQKDVSLPDIPDSLLAGVTGSDSNEDNQGNNQTTPGGNTGDGDSSYTPSVLPTSDYAKKIIADMEAMGYNDYAISGALGNFAAESGLNPIKTQGDACNGADNATVRAWQGGASGRAIGFAQWDGNRALGLIDAATDAGVAWYDFDFQVNYYLKELAANGCGVDTFNSNASDTEHAAWWFVKSFERCGTCKYAPCSGSSYGQIANGAHGVGSNAVYVDYENRSHINGWNHRYEGAADFYVTYF